MEYKFFSQNLPDTEVIEVNGKKEEVPIDISKLPDDDWRKYPDRQNTESDGFLSEDM
jgi:regulator of sigma E protease